MKTDFYTKAVLTVIAFCLIVLILQGGATKAVASESSNYALVPINPDGSVNVNVKTITADQEVIIAGWKGKFSSRYSDLDSDTLPVKNK
jgi:hypothetical protein